MDDLIRNRNAKLEAFQQEIDTLKETLSNNVKEKESLSTTLTVFKTESKEKNLNTLTRKLFWKNKIKNWKTLFAQQIQPTLYDGSVIAKKHDLISMIDDEETLILEEERRSKMLDKQNDLISIKQKINISPIDYSKLNNLKEDLGKRFVTQQELSAEQAFWLKHSNYNPDTSVKSHTPVRNKAPSELPKVSLVNESLKNLKYHLTSFDKVVKKRTTSDAITAVVVDQCSVDKNTFEIEKKELKLENERLLEHIICQDFVNSVMHADVKFDNVLHVSNTFLDDNIALDILKMENDRLMELLVSQDLVYIAVNSLAVINDYQSMEISYIEEYEKNLKLAAELSQMNELSKTCSRLEQRCISLELKLQHKKESFQNNKPCENHDAPEFHEFFIINELKAQLQAKDTTISNLKKHIQELKGKSVADCCESMSKSKVIAPVVHKLDLEPLSSKLKNNREAHVDYIRITKENADTLRDIVEQARISNPLDNALAYACMYTKQIQELLVYVSDTCPNSPLKSEKLVVVTPMNKARKVTFAKTRLVQNPVSPTPYVPPSKKDYEIMFQLLIDEYFNRLPRAVSPDPIVVAAPRAVDPAGSPSSNYH
ncbi:hypothetical protein Tco_0496773 [Tanacetum coccineum]